MPPALASIAPARRAVLGAWAAVVVLAAPLAISGMPSAAQSAPAAVPVEIDTDTIPTPQADDGFVVRDHVIDVATAEGAARTVPAAIPLEGAPTMIVVDTDGAVVQLEVRSRNAGAWGEWTAVESSVEEAPDAGDEGGGVVPAIGPIWIGEDADAVELRIVGGEATTLRVETLENTVPEPELAQPTGAASVVAGQPAIIPRSSWATRGWRPEHDGCEDGPVALDQIRSIVVHHTVTSNSYSSEAVDDILRGIYRTHADVNGWCDIAYNFVVDRFGRIWEARTGSAAQATRGGHAKGFNTWTVGVALLGSHQSTPATTAALEAVQSVAAWRLSGFGVDPAGSHWLQNRSTRPPMRFPSYGWVQMPAIVGHRDLGVTACPGGTVHARLGSMRGALVDEHRAGPPHRAPDRRPAPYGPAVVTVETSGGLRAAGAAGQFPVSGVAAGTTAVAVAGVDGVGHVLASDGTLHSFGGAERVAGAPAGAVPVVDLVLRGESSGWVVDVGGGMHGFGGALDIWAPSTPVRVVAAAIDDAGAGHRVTSDGRLHRFGGAPDRSLPARVDAIDIALGADARSGWVLDRSGRLHAFGGAPAWQPESPVSAPRAVIASGRHGGWVLDAEGRFTRFGDERRMAPVSTTVGQPVAVDAAVVDWPIDRSVDDVAHAAALRELFLGAAWDPRASDQLAQRIAEDGTAEVVDELANSEAWAGAVVTEMYRDVLGRAPDRSGLAYWLRRLDGGLRTQDLGALFYSSPEYVDAQGGVDGWVRALYRELLEREADNSGIVYWRQRLAAGVAPYTITESFYASPESRGRRVDDLYQRILGRRPDAEGRRYWSEQLFHIDDIRLAVELAVSSEYYDRVTD